VPELSRNDLGYSACFFVVRHLTQP
jgi:hypothetical protein